VGKDEMEEQFNIDCDSDDVLKLELFIENCIFDSAGSSDCFGDVFDCELNLFLFLCFVLEIKI
jgi:hypothetical protein